MWGLIPLLLNLGSKALPLLTGPVTQAITGINVAQVWSNVVSVLAATVKFVEKHWRLCLIVLLAAGNVVGFSGWNHETQVLKAEQTAHKADVQSFKDAQAKADKDAKAQVQSLIQESKVKANAADKNYGDLLAKYNASLLRYRTNQSGAQSTGGHQGDNQASQVASSSDGSSQGSGLFITMKDAQICAENTARLVAAHDWAIHLGDSDAK